MVVLRLVIADTGPINYLVLIGCIDILPTLFGKVVLPSLVQAELSASKTPIVVQDWLANLPSWVEVHSAPAGFQSDPALRGIHEGEKAAIALAAMLQADLLLMNDRKGVAVARRKGLRVAGTLGILGLAAQEGLTNFAQALERLRQTNFRISEDLLHALLKNSSPKR